MQDYLSTNKPVAFNIHPKQRNVKERQWIMRDEGKLYTYLDPQAKRNKFSVLSMNFSPYLPSLLKLCSLPFSPKTSTLSSPKLHSPHFFLFFFFFFSSLAPLFFFGLVPLNDLCRNHLFFASLFLQPPFLCFTLSAATFSVLHSFCSHLFSTSLFLQPPFLSHSFCSFKKRGWFLLATKDVTRGPLG